MGDHSVIPRVALNTKKVEENSAPHGFEVDVPGTSTVPGYNLHIVHFSDKIIATLR